MKISRYIFAVSALMTVLCTSCRGQNEDGWQEIPDRPAAQVNDGDYTITGGVITEKVLRNYLSRAITEAEYLNSETINTDGHWGTEDDERMLLNVGAKFIGRAIYTWNKESKFNKPEWAEGAKAKIARIHAKDPDVIFQAAMFETVSFDIKNVKIPAFVFEAFGKTPEDRYFDFDAIKDENGARVGEWGSTTCVPDMSHEETQMWFYFIACRYMDMGIEALHCGQVNLMCSLGDKDNNYAGFRRLVSLIREAAKTRTRRGMVLLDAHCVGIVIDGKHLLDFGSYPLRLAEKRSSTTMEAELKPGNLDCIIGKTLAGTTPSGWYTKRLPYLLEFDNFGVSKYPGQYTSDYFIWGYDEISWIGLVSEEYAGKFVRYAVDFLNTVDPVGYLQMPGMRIQKVFPKEGESPYRCNTRSAACPKGRNLEETIKAVWAAK
ncbi:MAG: hypothetical protein MJY62_02155 [Bacteroidales bacterium]|nr:hypothetical protein [Bacteroidales bacterium]